MILASASQRRIDLLKKFSYDFTVEAADIEEKKEGKDPQSLVMALAYEKALKVAKDHTHDLVLGADTLVFGQGRAYGKAQNRDQAREFLKDLSGKTHQVYTGFALVNLDQKLKIIDYDVTSVTFKDLTDQELEAYLDSGEWEGKAGAYAIQAGAGNFVKDLDGDLNNVIGLPSKLCDYLEDLDQ